VISTSAPSRHVVPRLLSLWGPVVALMLAIHVFSSMSNPPAPPTLSDKTLHVTTYAVLAMLLLRALAGGSWRGVTPGTLLGCVAITVLYGVKDEWHQMFTPGRTPDVMDVAADFAGALGSAIVAGAWSIIRRL
jgi:VanZ family protein